MKVKFKYILSIALIGAITGLMGAAAATKIFNANEVSYDNSATGIDADNVQDAVDELYEEAEKYNGLRNRSNTSEDLIANIQNRLISVQSSYNNLFTSYAYSTDTYTTDSGLKVVAEKRSGVVTITVRGTVGSDPLPIKNTTYVLTQLPEKYRPAPIDGNVSKITYVLVHKKYRMQLYVTPSGNVTIGYGHNVVTKADEDYPNGYGFYASMTYVTNK